MTKIALFGTSADPPTAGHQAILRWLSDRYDWVAVWASDNPFKGDQTSLEHRTKMLRLLIGEIETPRNNISLHEELSDRRSLVTVEKAREIWGREVEFILVIGSDLVSQIRRWYRVEELLQKVQVLVVPRLGYPIEENDLEALCSLGGKWAIADLQVPAVSSTAYREKGDKNTVTQPVKDYIHREQLYGWQKAARA
ncbi:MAG: nicotinate-nucleotide adenylyltransferase [Xenococcaceae cyanobacterium]